MKLEKLEIQDSRGLKLAPKHGVRASALPTLAMLQHGGGGQPVPQAPAGAFFAEPLQLRGSYETLMPPPVSYLTSRSSLVARARPMSGSAPPPGRVGSVGLHPAPPPLIEHMRVRTTQQQTAPVAHGYYFGEPPAVPATRAISPRSLYAPEGQEVQEVPWDSISHYPGHDNGYLAPRAVRKAWVAEMKAKDEAAARANLEQVVQRPDRARAQRAANIAPADDSRRPGPVSSPRVVYVDHEEPNYRSVTVEQDVLVPRYEKVEVEEIQVKENIIEVDRVDVQPENVDVEKITVKEVQVPFDVYVDNIVVREVPQEVEMERLILKEVEVPVEKVVVKEVLVPVERVVENVITKEVPVERIIVKEVPVEIEKIVIKDVQKPRERIIENVIERPVEKIVEKERIVRQERIVYEDRIVEVPVDRSMDDRDQARTLPHRPAAIEMPRAKHVQRKALPEKGERQQLPKEIGIGVLLKRSSQFPGMTMVDHIVPGFACANSGKVRTGDLVLAVDGQDIEGWELDNVKQLTIGFEGSVITLTCQRGRCVCIVFGSCFFGFACITAPLTRGLELGSDKFVVSMTRVSPSVFGSDGQEAIHSYFR